jgi:hypothetical protein
VASASAYAARLRRTAALSFSLTLAYLYARLERCPRQPLNSAVRDRLLV